MKRPGLTISFLFVVFGSLAQYTSPFNDLSVVADSTDEYSFIVSGHFYGDGTNRSGYPANTLLANIDWINDSEASMIICLGDLFMDIKNDLPKYQMSLFDKLEIPLVNSVGNHDLTDRIYQENFGATYFRFNLGNDIHLVLDTELDNGDISDEQLDLLNAVKKECESGDVKNVFVYAHRTIWKDSYPELENLFQDNTQGLTESNFKTDVLPLASAIASHSSLYWFAGSLGDAPASFFYFEDEKNKITFIATAIRALLRDALLIVHVKNTGVEFETKSLTNQNLMPLERYNAAYWNETSAEEPFNYKLIPLYIKNVFLHYVFWYGIGFASAVFGLIWLIRRRKRK